MRKLSGELDYRIRYDVEHNLFYAKNVFNEEYIAPTFIEYVQKLEKENAELKRHCLKFNPNTMIEFGAYVLYYSANPESKMDIPNCIYEKVEKMYSDWNKRCENCKHDEEQQKAIKEGKQGCAICMLECNASHTCFEPKE